ncbi:MAG: cupin domain-containing protein [Cyclobacteriaceae bacterium]|nr:cupin domain-containing protein [Cyclobacteriaceae bacterium HetDA_MAG_MS6]
MYFNELDQLEEKEIMPGFYGKFLHMENMTIAYWRVMKGSVLPEHSHHHEQSTNVISGQLEMTIDGQTQVVDSSIPVTIPSHVPHSGKALSDCLVVDIFSPKRDEYR